MKANKALKRLTKIEALMADVAERYSASPPHIREVLQDAKAAVIRAKEAVSLQASSRTAKKAAPGRRKAGAKQATAPTAETAKKNTPIKKAATKRAIKKMAPVQVGTEPPVQ
jgi:hypothetical protein